MILPLWKPQILYIKMTEIRKLPLCALIKCRNMIPYKKALTNSMKHSPWETDSTLSWPRNSLPFMEPGGSLLCSQEPGSQMIQPTTSNSMSVRSILISSHLCVSHPSGLFPPGFQTQIFSTFPTHLTLLNMIILLILHKFSSDLYILFPIPSYMFWFAGTSGIFWFSYKVTNA